MTTETAINRILNNAEWPDSLKILKLQNLALRTFPSSPNQKLVIATYQALQEIARQQSSTEATKMTPDEARRQANVLDGLTDNEREQIFQLLISPQGDHVGHLERIHEDYCYECQSWL